ncbi:hypothetical protein [Microvirga sp. TS319]|uniref:hypothetical protein n=1 Tax=Microvirga sp. TS319 TaxID=3241165 RepID=UPI00351A6A1E
MTKTVTALFHSEPHATAAANHLEQAGISRDAIAIWSTPHNLASFLEDEGLSRADAHAYAEGVLRGGSLVIVKSDDVDRVVSILDQEGVLDLDEQQASWRTEGWQGELTARSTAGTETPVTGELDEVVHGRVRIRAPKAESPERE